MIALSSMLLFNLPAVRPWTWIHSREGYVSSVPNPATTIPDDWLETKESLVKRPRARSRRCSAALGPIGNFAKISAISLSMSAPKFIGAVRVVKGSFIWLIMVGLHTEQWKVLTSQCRNSKKHWKDCLSEVRTQPTGPTTRTLSSAFQSQFYDI